MPACISVEAEFTALARILGRPAPATPKARADRASFSIVRRLRGLTPGVPSRILPARQGVTGQSVLMENEELGTHLAWLRVDVFLDVAAEDLTQPHADLHGQRRCKAADPADRRGE